MSKNILVQEDEQILRIIINRPDDGNIMSDDMALELTRLLEGSGKFRLVVLRGAGNDFCIGRASMGARKGGQPEALDRREQSDVVFNCYGSFRRAPVPVIGVVQGRAFGFGCSMAALCDVTLAGDEATFQIPEMGHRIMPTMVMSSLVDRVDRKALSYMVYSTAVVGAKRALTFGIVSEVVPQATLDARLDELCAMMLAAPAPATEGVKDYLRTAYGMDVPGAVDYARNIHATVNSSSRMRK